MASYVELKGMRGCANELAQFQTLLSAIRYAEAKRSHLYAVTSYTLAVLDEKVSGMKRLCKVNICSEIEATSPQVKGVAWITSLSPGAGEQRD